MLFVKTVKVNEMEVKKILLDDVTVVRKIPMSNAGCDNLRAAQKYLVDGMTERLGKPVELPFPTVIHMVLADFVKRNNINVTGKSG